MDENQSLLPPIFNPKDYEIKLEANNDSKDKIEEELLPNLKNHKSNKNDHRRHQNQEDFVSSILDQDNDNVIDFFENVDPMLAWALLKSKILPQVGMFDLLAERSKLKNANEPVGVVKSLLDELDSLVTEVITMLQNCCETYDHHSGSQDHNQLLNSIQLNPSLSLHLCGTNQSNVIVKPIDAFPTLYKEKLFKPPEMKPLELVKTELETSDIREDIEENDEENEESDQNVEDENDEEIEENELKSIEKVTTTKKSGKSKRPPKTCEKCHKTYNTQTQFRIHQRDAWRCPGKPEPKWLRIVKGKDYYCLHPDCSSDGVNGPMFARRNKYWHHLRDKHWDRDNFAFDCSYCQEKFPFYDMLRQHIKQYHEKAHVCKYCGSSFSRRRDLTLHERRHTGEKPHACDKCDFRCNTAGSLRMHIVRRHEDPTLHRTHVCEICGKSFHAAYILKEHILTHSDIKRYTCDICGRQLRNDSCYRRHMMNIHGQKISCDHCNKDFSSPIGLKIHKRDTHGIMY